MRIYLLVNDKGRVGLYRIKITCRAEIIKVEVVTIEVLSIDIKFENFMQVGCRDLGAHYGRTVYCRKPIILPKLVLFFGTLLELPVLPSIICVEHLHFNSCQNISH